MGAIVNGIALDPAMLRPYGSTFLIFSDYMRPAVRLSALMGLRNGLGLDARLGRCRRGRPDAPAGRAPHGAARDPEPLVRPPGRRERDRDGVADRARAGGRPGRARAHAAEAADVRPQRGRRCGGRAPRRLHALAARRRRAGGDRDRDRLRGARRARRRPLARRERPRRLDAVLGALRGAGRGVPRVGPAAAVEARVSIEAGVTFGWERYARAVDRDRPLRRLRSVPADPRRARPHSEAVASALEAQLDGAVR